MPNQKMHLEFSAALNRLTEVNESFDKGILRIAYTGSNRNHTYISQETFEKAIPSMYCCPIVANYIREEDEIGSHDGELVKDSNGDYKYVNITEPIGFVPPNAQWTWEEVIDDEACHKYLTTEVLLWKRQEAYEKVKSNGITSQSMEIVVNEGKMRDDNDYEILDFYFTAFCLLGKAEPCFESAALFTFSLDNLKSQINDMLQEFQLAIRDTNDIQEKEGEKFQMDKFNELLEKYGKTIEDITFDYENLSNEELEAKFEAEFGASDPKPIPVPASEPKPDKDFALSGQLRTALCEQLSTAETIDSEYGSYSKYWLVDFDESLSEVYFEDISDGKLYGTTYSFNGDNVLIDFRKKCRKKYAIVDFDEGEQQIFNLKDCVDQIINVVNATNEAKYNDLSAKYEELSNKHNEILAEQHLTAAENLYEEFGEKLNGVEDYVKLKDSLKDIPLNELEERLYSLVGRVQFKLNTKNNNSKSPKVGVAFSVTDKDEKPYGDLFSY